MQVNTLTITTEQTKAGRDLFKITSFEMTTEAFCDCCAASASGKEADLRRRGWHLGSREQFCPSCNY